MLMQAGADYPEAVDIAMSGAGLEEVPHAVMGIVTSPSVAEVKEEVGYVPMVLD